MLTCTLLLWTSVLPAAEAAKLPDFDLPAQKLERALAQFSLQSGAAAGMAGSIPDITTTAVRGRFTPAEALSRMLVGTNLEAVPVSADVFRLQLRAIAARVATPPAPVEALRDDLPDEVSDPLAEVQITATKRQHSLSDVPLSVAVVSGNSLDSSAALPGSRAALAFNAATSSTNFGPGRNRQFIRGVADSPFLGSSQATVSVQFDETRLNYSAPDPDLRLLDVERVEVLEGPQGPLYGSGALGGVFHIVPRRPDLAAGSGQFSTFITDVTKGSTAPGVAGVFNLPLRKDELGLRAVVYAADEPGWIDNANGRDNANNTQVGGGRLALRAEGGAWSANLQAALQLASTRDSPYVIGESRTLKRSGILPEPRDSDLYFFSGTLRGPVGSSELLLSTSYVNHEVTSTEDASAAAPRFGLASPLIYDDERSYHLFTNELRLTGGTRVPWLLGASWLRTRDRSTSRLQPPAAADVTLTDLEGVTSELALFGEVAHPLGKAMHVTAGLRLARVTDEDESRNGLPEQEAAVVHTATPSLSLDWRSRDERRFVYLRFAQAERPGGLNPDGSASAQHFRSDRLSSLDLGSRLRLAGDQVTLQSAFFATNWEDVQADYLLPSGLLGTRNVGSARNFGIETALRFELGRYAVEASGVLQYARLENPVVQLVNDDARLPVVPDVRAGLSLSRRFVWQGWQGQWLVRADFTGASRLSFEPQLDRRAPSFATAAAGLNLARAGYSLRLDITNLLDSRADTFAFGNPFSIGNGDQHTPLQPRTITLGFQRRW